MRPGPDVVAHEELHVAAAIALGLEVEPVEWGSAVFDGFAGQVRLTAAARQSLTGSYQDRLRYATLAMVPSVAIFRAEGCEGDMRVVDEMRPDDYSVRLWRFIVEGHARKLLDSAAFVDAFALAAERIELQIAASA